MKGVITSAAVRSKNRFGLQQQQRSSLSISTTMIVRSSNRHDHSSKIPMIVKNNKTSTPARRNFAAAGGGHHDHHPVVDMNTAAGADAKYLNWPVMPVPQSMNAEMFPGRVTEGWEFTIGWWYLSSFILIWGIVAFQPNDGIDVWAAREAQARLDLKEKHGFTDFEFGKHYQDVQEEKLKNAWDVFARKAFNMSDDDDDDEEEEDDDDDE
jgi:hypothetical protein